MPSASKSQREKFLAAAKNDPKWREWLKEFGPVEPIRAANGVSVPVLNPDELPDPNGQTIDPNAGAAGTLGGATPADVAAAAQEISKDPGALEKIGDAVFGRGAPLEDVARVLAGGVKNASDFIAASPPYQFASGLVDATKAAGEYIADPFSDHPGSARYQQAQAQKAAAAAANVAPLAPAGEEQTSSAPAVAASAPENQGVRVAPSAPGAQPVQVAAEPDWAIEARRAALMDVQAARAKADALTEVNRQYLDQLQAAQNRRAEEVRISNARADQYEKAILNAEIDPNRYWGSKSTGQQILGCIGIALGGYGAGLTGGPNLAMEQLNRQIDRDIAAQKANLGKRESLYSQHLARTRDAAAAYQQTQADLLAMARGQVQLVADQFGGQEAAAKAQAMMAAISRQIVDNNEKAANARMERALKAAEIRKLNVEAELAKSKADAVADPRVVHVPVTEKTPSGREIQTVRPMVAADPTMAHEARKKIAAANKLLSMLQEYREIAARNPHGGNLIFDKGDVVRAQQLQALIQREVSTQQEQGVIRDAEIPAYEKIVEDITKFRLGVSPEYTVGIDNMMKVVRNGVTAYVEPLMVR